MPALETSRLLLRPPRPNDGEAFYAFLGDPAAMRFTHHHASLRECRRRLAAFEWGRPRKGYAPWAVITKADAQLVGWGGLYDDPFTSGWGVELGYALHPAARNLGYATELARACLSWADEELALPVVRAFVHPENAASRRVLAKVGFEPVGLIPELGCLLHARTRHRAI